MKKILWFVDCNVKDVGRLLPIKNVVIDRGWTIQVDFETRKWAKMSGTMIIFSLSGTDKDKIRQRKEI